MNYGNGASSVIGTATHLGPGALAGAGQAAGHVSACQQPQHPSQAGANSMQMGGMMNVNMHMKLY